ncbi:MAG: polysaccharide biosynthesis C-terminal domain-containing protein [Butyrivibrio sp.]|nr:polysaccharide biosynthesis C-terminal domain-containing protein [Butyrivibrio sp.]
MFARTDKIIVRNYIKYLFPAILVGLGGAIQQFVDTIIVAKLIDSNAVAIENYAGPMVQYTPFTVKLIGCGGAVIYATLMGKMEREKAAGIYSTAMILATIMSFIVTIPGLFFIRELDMALGCSQELMGDFQSYMIPTLILIPISIIMMTFASFLPAMGYPGLTFRIVLTANIVNVILDVVYIKFFKMGIAGAQWATISGYVVALIAMIFALKKDHFVFSPIKNFNVAAIKDIFIRGLPSGLSQLGLLTYYWYFNRLVTQMGGTEAMKAFSICLQLLAICAILINGVSENVRNFVSMLNSAEDKQSVRYVMKNSSIILVLWGVVLLAMIQLFPGIFVDLYSIQDGRELAIHALRIYSFIVLFKGMAIIARDYLNTTGRPYHAMAVTLTEGSVGVIILGTILGGQIGLDGVWMAFPLTSCICCILVAIYLFSWGKSHVQNDSADYEKMYMTLPVNSAKPVLPSQEISDYYKTKVQNKTITERTALLVEEMYIYSVNHTKKLDYIDVMLQIHDNESRILFRSLGEPFDPMNMANEEEKANVLLLNKITSEIKYEYIMGMNTTCLKTKG